MARFASSVAISAVLLCASCAVVPQRTQFQMPPSGLVGRWSGTDNTGKKGEMHFFANGRIMFVIDEMRIGDAGSGSRFDVTYTVDVTTNPWHLDVMVKESGVAKGVLRGLLEVVDESTIRVGFDTTSKERFGDLRPAAFSSLKEESIITLKKEPNQSPQTTPVSAPR